MSNNPNMNYCKFQNTLQALRQCENDMKATSSEEKKARLELLTLCYDLVTEYDDLDGGFNFNGVNDSEDEE